MWKNRLFVHVVLVFILTGISVGSEDSQKLLQMAAHYLDTSVNNTATNDPASTTDRIIPVAVVTRGLLEAGFDSHEPLVRSGIEFLEHALAADGFVYSSSGEKLLHETELIQNCFRQAVFPAICEPSEKHCCVFDHFSKLLENGSDKNVARAMGFIAQIQMPQTDDSIRHFSFDKVEFAIVKTAHFTATFDFRRSIPTFDLSSVSIDKLFGVIRPTATRHHYDLFRSEFPVSFGLAPVSPRKIFFFPLLEETILIVRPVDPNGSTSFMKSGYISLAQTVCRRE